jgi:Demethylmenaquinone methyltransferase
MNNKGEVTRKKLSPTNFLKQFSQGSIKQKKLRSGITTSQLSDALRRITGQNGVLVGTKSIKRSFKIFGTATTVKTSANDWGTVINGIYEAEKGNILVISCDRDDPAVWGEMASTAAKKQGILGTVVYGAIRDIAGIKELNYPVFSRATVPNAGNPIGEGEVNIPIICGRTTIKPGDLIIGDECGVVSVPLEVIDTVLIEAYKILDNEDHITSQLNEGISFLDILRNK